MYCNYYRKKIIARKRLVKEMKSLKFQTTIRGNY